MPDPDLHVFAISHYCEKARWALDHHGVAYALRHLAPGAHVQVAQQLGAPGTSVPILVAGGRVVQGSSAILDWADARTVDPARRLAPEPEHSDACRAIEARLDDVAGVHTRRYYYSEALVEYPETVLPVFTRDLAADEARSLEQGWDFIRQAMTARMDLGAEQGRESRLIVEGELDWIESLLADGRRYLLGDHFSRADVTAASLLAPLVRPQQHPTYGGIVLPPGIQADLARWGERPALAWVREMYRAHR